MKISELINENLIITEIEAQDSYEAIKMLGNVLLKEGYVKDTFTEAVIKREKKYPTGIQCIGCNIAIPHTDSSHVIKPGIAIGTFNGDVFFNKMDNPEEEINTDIIFMLAIKTSETHLGALKKIMNMSQDSNTIKTICSYKDSKEIINLLKEGGE